MQNVSVSSLNFSQLHFNVYFIRLLSNVIAEFEDSSVHLMRFLLSTRTLTSSHDQYKRVMGLLKMFYGMLSIPSVVKF